MECKSEPMWIREIDFSELIDTLWNVNHRSVILWQGKRGRINRYIMECK